jgi:hypothetical protein
MVKPLTEELKQQWKDRILEQRSSGLSIPKWCRQNDVPIYNFRYWQDKLLPVSIERSAFTEMIPKKDNQGICLECQGMKIYLSPGFDTQVLKKCLEVIKTC